MGSQPLEGSLNLISCPSEHLPPDKVTLGAYQFSVHPSHPTANFRKVRVDLWTLAGVWHTVDKHSVVREEWAGSTQCHGRRGGALGAAGGRQEHSVPWEEGEHSVPREEGEHAMQGEEQGEERERKSRPARH